MNNKISMFPYNIYDSKITVERPYFKFEPGLDTRFVFKNGIPNYNLPGSTGNGIYPGGYGVGIWSSGFTKDTLFFGVPDPAGFSPFEKPGNNVWHPKNHK